MKIYTKTGDTGTTGLFAGGRVAKDHPRICAYGTVDELNALIGVAAIDVLETPLLARVAAELHQIQSDLFCIGAELATPDPDKNKMRFLTPLRIDALERNIDELDGKLPFLENFILPGGGRAAAMLHLARTVCRRAEREVVQLTHIEPTCDCTTVAVYLNRLSDLLFVMARFVNHELGIADSAWRKPD